MKQITKTILMGVLAALLCGTAAFFYPQTSAELTTGETGQKLFEEFENKVWSVQIAKFDRETENLKTLALRRKAQKWVLGKSNMVATGPLITVAVGALNEKKILQEESDNEQDHAKFGVVDPADFQTVKNRGSLGMKITLEDLNRNTMASLIVGHKVKKTEDQYYVRRPGQPKVYTVAFERSVLTTAIGDWMDTNIIGLRSQRNPDGMTLKSISVNNYRIDSVGPDKGTVKHFYDTTIEFTPKGLLLQEFKIPDGGNWIDLNPSPKQAEQLSQVGIRLQNVRLVDAQAKPTKLGKAIAADASKLTASLFASAAEKGFLLNAGEPKFQSSNGSLTVVSEQGVETTLLFGGVATTSEAPADSLNYYMIVIAKVAQQMQNQPVAPKPDEEGGELTDDQKKTFAREMKTWKSDLESATQQVQDINRRHADWYYVVSDDLVGFLRPDLKVDPVKQKETPVGPTSTPTGEASQEKPDETKTDSPEPADDTTN